MPEPVEVIAEPTPNPNSMKFTVNRAVVSGRSQTFKDPSEAMLSPLAQRLFQIDGVRSLFLMKDFVSVGRNPDASWQAIVPAVEAALRSFFASQE